jgi:hypothetical protein
MINKITLYQVIICACLVVAITALFGNDIKEASILMIIAVLITTLIYFWREK